MMKHHSNVFKYFIILTCTSFLFIAIWIQLNLRNYKGIQLEPNTEYDYIIVGAGTVGCVLASKISENGTKKVLLLESGDNFGFASTVPLFSTLLQGSKYDWNFKTASQEYSSYGLFNFSQSLPRGRGLGGSGMINYMIHGDPVVEDFKNWGVPEWDYEKLLSYLKYEKNNKNYCASKHALTEEFCPLEKPQVKPSLHLVDSNCELTHYFSKAVSELKNPELVFKDTNITVFQGQRWTSFHAYLKPVLERKNLHIALNNHVTKLIFKGEKAIGVETMNLNGEKMIVYSKNDIILSAGALQTPQILLLSGIGPIKQLKKLGIDVLVDLPGVGENLHDQLNIPMYVSIQSPKSVTIDKVFSFEQFWDYFFYHKGYLASTPIAGLMKGPDHTGLLLFAMGSTDEKLLREIANFKPETFKTIFPLYKNSSQEGFVFLPTCLQPKSRGSVYLQSKDPLRMPIIDPNYLSNYYDIECTIKALKFAIEIIHTSVFQQLGAKIHWPLLPNCQHLPVEPMCDDYLECIIRTVALTAHHPGGTCKIGNVDDPMSVVDGSLRVKNTKNLRVMDASILPRPLSTFPNDILIRLGEYAAHIITGE